MCAILAFSVYGLRRSHYEIFLITHILFSVIVLLTMFYHVEIFNGEWNTFIHPCLAVWLLDRILRALRILAFNWNPLNTRAMATYDTASNLIRLEVPCEHSLLKPQPGSYYYIYVLDELLYMHQNHPFTLAYISSNTDDSDTGTPLSSSTTSRSRPSAHRTPSTDSHESDSLLPSTSASPPSLIFLIRPYDGFTSRLKSLISSTISPHGRSVRVLLEGPYGSPAQLHGFQTTLFIVGGTGIAVPLSYLKSLLAESSTARTIHIVWAVRDHSFVTDIAERDLKRYVNDGRFRLTVHVTQDEEMKNGINHEGGGVGSIEKITLKAGRPDVDMAVREAAEEVGMSGRLAVVACGPAQMADDARRACVRALGRGYRGVEYFEESFKW
jgi:predicted ferric reductase